MISLTGATGHLGQSILRQLHSADQPVGAVVRDGSDESLLKPYCEWIAEVPLDDVNALTEVFAGSDFVIHSAACIDIRRGHLPLMRKVNIEGTRNVLEACRRSGVRRLVYISSIEAFDLSAKRRPVREDFGFAAGNAIMEYGETKAEASRMVVAAGFHGDIETILICPSGIIGPWDFLRGLFTTMIGNYLNSKLPALIHGGFDFVDVRDVAGAAIAAGKRGRSGEAYLVSGTYMEIRQLLGILEEVSGIKPPRLTISPALGRMAAKIMETWANIFDITVPLTQGSMSMLSKQVSIDSSKAEEELGFQARPLEETLRDMVTWHRDPAAKTISPAPAAAASHDPPQ